MTEIEITDCILPTLVIYLMVGSKRGSEFSY